MILKTAQIIKDDFFGSDPVDTRATKGWRASHFYS